MNRGLIISLVSGLSTLISLVFMIDIKNKEKVNKVVEISLSFCFIYMILISLLDIFPESLKFIKNKPFLDIFLYTMVNYTIIILFLKISSKINKNKVGEGKLYFLGIISMISLLIHNILEGIITCTVSNINIKLGIRLSLSIIMHNIPEGILICVPIYYSTKNKKRGVLCTFLSSLGEIIGALLSIIFIKNYLNSAFIGYLMISISLIMILIAVEEIFPQINGKNKKNTLIGIFGGIIIFLLNIIIFK